LASCGWALQQKAPLARPGKSGAMSNARKGH
jgi:hypothetical protein